MGEAKRRGTYAQRKRKALLNKVIRSTATVKRKGKSRVGALMAMVLGAGMRKHV